MRNLTEWLKEITIFAGALLLCVVITLFGIWVVSTQEAKAAPILRQERTLLPETDSLYDLGTSTKAWRDIFVDRLCFTADTCRTTWPSGGSSFAYLFPSNATTTSIAFNGGLTGILTGSLVGNASTASAFATGRTISISGDLTYTSPSFDGSGNVTAAGTLATVNANVGSFGGSTAIPVITANGKGLITAISTAAVVAPAGTLSGATLAAGVTASSLTSVGTLSTLTVSGQTTLGYASTTGISTGYASSTVWRGGGLTTDCDTAATSKLLWDITTGQFSCGTDQNTGSGAGYPFAVAGNATTTLTQFNGGLTSYASTTIGNGTATGGLTVSGNSTTTGVAYFGDNVGLGIKAPTEILHLSKTTGNFTTERFDSGTTQGYLYSYDGDDSVNFGANSDSQLNFKQNNLTRGYISDATGNWFIQNAEGDDSIFTLKAPSADPQEASFTTLLPVGADSEWVDWTLENFGTDHQGSINVAKSGAGKIVPFSLRFWDFDKGPIDANGVYSQTWLPNGTVAIGVATSTAGAVAGGASTLLYGASSTAPTLFKLDAAAGTTRFQVTSAGIASTTNLNISGIASCSGANALTTNASGVVACGAITGTGFAYPFPSNATTTQLAFNGGLTAVGATTTALAVTGSTTVSSVLNVGGALAANSSLTVLGGTTLAGATSTSLAVTGSSTISSVLNVGGALAANSSLTVSGNTTLANATSTNEFSGRYTGNALAIGGTATTTIDSVGLLTAQNIVLSGVSANQLVYTNNSKQLVSVASSSLSLPNTALQNSTISGVALGSNLNALTATNGSLTFSCSYNGSAACTAGLNVGNANTWTAQQTFNTTAPIFGTMTAGSVLFAGTSGLLSQNNTKLFWNDAATSLEVGTSTGPLASIVAASSTAPQLMLSNATAGLNSMVLRVENDGGLHIATSTSIATSSVDSLVIIPTSGENSSRVGIGTNSPAELLHLSKPTGSFTTMRFDSGATQGYFFSYSGTPEVSLGSNSSAVVNIKVNNSTAWTWDTVNKHQVSNGSVPTVSSCAGFAATTGSNDNAGKITMTAGTTCLMNFGGTWSTRAPACTVTAGSGAVAVGATTLSTTQLGITAASNITSFYYTCVGI